MEISLYSGTAIKGRSIRVQIDWHSINLIGARAKDYEGQPAPHDSTWTLDLLLNQSSQGVCPFGAYF
jgi:hypothetical protein